MVSVLMPVVGHGMDLCRSLGRAEGAAHPQRRGEHHGEHREERGDPGRGGHETGPPEIVTVPWDTSDAVTVMVLMRLLPGSGELMCTKPP